MMLNICNLTPVMTFSSPLPAVMMVVIAMLLLLFRLHLYTSNPLSQSVYLSAQTVSITVRVTQHGLLVLNLVLNSQFQVRCSSHVVVLSHAIAVSLSHNVLYHTTALLNIVLLESQGSLELLHSVLGDGCLQPSLASFQVPHLHLALSLLRRKHGLPTSDAPTYSLFTPIYSSFAHARLLVIQVRQPRLLVVRDLRLQLQVCSLPLILADAVTITALADAHAAIATALIDAHVLIVTALIDAHVIISTALIDAYVLVATALIDAHVLIATALIDAHVIIATALIDAHVIIATALIDTHVLIATALVNTWVARIPELVNA